MPASDILNPTPYWSEDIQDSMCPNYGWTRKRTNTQLKKKAIGGTPWTRETANTGHSFNFTWSQRSWACVQRLKRYYEQYEDGFFTIVDWDGGGRQYVGRFTTEVTPVEVGNGMWDVQNVTFEEMPQVAMVEYPGDWDNDAVILGPYNDFGDQKLATSAAAILVVNPFAIVAPQMPQNFIDLGSAEGNWGTYEYRGYGFKLFLLCGPAQGQCTITVDGEAATVLVARQVWEGDGLLRFLVPGGADCYSAALGVQCVCSDRAVDLDIHRVQVTATGAHGAESTGTDITWAWLQVMR